MKQLKLGKLAFRVGYDCFDIIYKPKYVLFYIAISRKYSIHNAKLQIIFLRRVI